MYMPFPTFRKKCFTGGGGGGDPGMVIGIVQNTTIAIGLIIAVFHLGIEECPMIGGIVTEITGGVVVPGIIRAANLGVMAVGVSPADTAAGGVPADMAVGISPVDTVADLAEKADPVVVPAGIMAWGRSPVNPAPDKIHGIVILRRSGEPSWRGDSGGNADRQDDPGPPGGSIKRVIAVLSRGIAGRAGISPCITLVYCIYPR
jgi:hypothetical protein